MSQKQFTDQVVLEGERAILNTLAGGPGGRPTFQGEKSIADLSLAIGKRGATILPRTIGLIPTDLPLRTIHMANGRLVFLVEYPPGPRTVRWLSDGSPAQPEPHSPYRDVTIALPYVLFFITTTWEGELRPSSVYFRTEPLKQLDYTDGLLDCHFLNCSPNSCGVYCWICSQYMPQRPAAGQSLVEFVASCIDNFWFSAFNLSSERHEGQSFFGKGCGTRGETPIPDPRVLSIRAWEEASREDPSFALTVPWNPAQRTVNDVFTELTGGPLCWPFKTASHLGNLILSVRRKGG